MKFNKKFWATAFTLTGTIIGAGILGLPYVFAQAGFFVGVFWLIILGSIVLYTNLCLGEISLRTKETHQIPGYAEKYLGKSGKRLMLFAIAFGVYAALLAYLIGEGQSLSKIFTGGTNYALHFGIGFWFLMTFLLKEGLRGLKRVETWGVLAIIGIILYVFASFFPRIDYANINFAEYSNFFLPFGVVMFAMLGFAAIPEMRRTIKGQEKNLRKSIIVGTLIPVVLYIMFAFAFVGVLGKNVEQVATLSFGNVITVLGIFTMLTSYFVLSFALKDIFRYDLKRKELSFWFVSLVPLALYVLVSLYGFLDFVKVIGIGGVVSGGLTAIIVFVMNIKSKKKGKRRPEFKIPINEIIALVLGIVFVFGMIAEIFPFLFS